MEQAFTYEAFRQRYHWDFSETKSWLGEGGFGKVYLAKDTVQTGLVAIKVAPVNPNRLKINLLHEFELVKKQLPVRHPNIVTYESCHRFETEIGLFDFAVLEYYPEGNLKQLMAKKKLSEVQKVGIATQILDGIEYYQQRGVIHRDLKPENILLAKTPKGEWIPKIGDFGISKAVELLGQSRFTNTLQGGTPYFAAPEQLVGTKIGLTSDMWAYGVLIYWILTGELPFQAAQEHGVNRFDSYLAAVHEGQGLKHLQKIPQPFRQMVEVCLIYDPAQRVKTATDLKKYLAVTPVVTKPAYSKAIWIGLALSASGLAIWVAKGSGASESKGTIESPQWATETKQIMVQPTRYVAIPATYETMTKTFQSKPESNRIITIPAVLETTTETMMVSPEHRSKDILETVSENLLTQSESKRILTVPPTYKKVSEQVLINSESMRAIPSENGCRFETVPAQFKTISKFELRTPSTFKEETIPAEYSTVTIKQITKKGSGGTLVPAEYRTLSRRLLKTAATIRVEAVPAEYSTYTCQVMKTPAKCDSVAAVYKTVSVKRLVKAAICKGDSSKIQKIQHPAEYESVEILDAAGKLIRTEKIETVPEYFTYQIVQK